MANTWFRFKQFTIEQAHSPMKVGVDGVLLGAWALERFRSLLNDNVTRALDVGTGTGLIALMVAQETPMRIDAIEINKDALRDAGLNTRQSPWTERLNLVRASFQDYAERCTLSYDLIISNPPFFHRSLKPAGQGRAEARHNDSLPLADLLNGVDRLLAEDGRFYLIIPTDQAARLEEGCRARGLCILHKTYVKPTSAKAPHRLLLELGREHKPCTVDELVIESGGRHAYSPEYIRLTRFFYLSM